MHDPQEGLDQHCARKICPRRGKVNSFNDAEVLLVKRKERAANNQATSLGGSKQKKRAEPRAYILFKRLTGC